MDRPPIWFWQRMVTPHMAHLATALARSGYDVSYVAEEERHIERAALGWQVPNTDGIVLRFARNAGEAATLVMKAPDDTVHFTQGLRSNGNVAFAQAAIKDRGQRHYVIMETVDLRGLRGLIKPALYFWHLQRWRSGLNGILAIGADTPAWLRRLAPASVQVYPFVYFLPEPPNFEPTLGSSRFRFLFVGEFIPRKRVDFFLRALGGLSGLEFEIELVGNGPMRGELEGWAQRILPGRVSFSGVLPISEIPQRMAQADCLVLPSGFDGWGAVVSEALMVGTPVICSAACGSRAVVQASGAGGVFDTLDMADLRRLLESALARGKINCDQRLALRSWARCLGADAGAAYLGALITGEPAQSHVLPPWEQVT